MTLVSRLKAFANKIKHKTIDGQTNASTTDMVLGSGSRYRLQGSDAVFSSTVRDFSAWMKHIEGKVDQVLYSTGVPKPNIAFIQVQLMYFNGVARTSSWNGGKLIQISTKYIRAIPSSRRYAEITGVVLHELTHALQYNGRSTCPGGLIEGIADFVRLKGGYGAPNWRKDTSGGPLKGYGATALFLNYVNDRHPNFVARLNDKLRQGTYSSSLWSSLTGKSLDQLWREYVATR